MKRMKNYYGKRILSWLLVMALMLASFAVPVQASETMDEWTDVTVIEAGEDEEGTVSYEDTDVLADEEKMWGTEEADTDQAAGTDVGTEASGDADIPVEASEAADVWTESPEDALDFEDTADSLVEGESEEGVALEEDDFLLEVEEVADPGLVLESDGDKFVISSAEDFPTEIAEGATYILGADITLETGQQIGTLAGTLDGQGHVITLADKPLANEVTGTIQNLGVAGTLTTDACIGSMAVKLNEGLIRNSYSTASISGGGWNELGGLTGQMINGTVRNSYYAGTITPDYSFMDAAGITSYASSGSNIIENCYYTLGIGVIYDTGCTITDCAQKSESDFKSGAVNGLLNANMTDTGFIFAAAEDGGYPVLTEGHPVAGEVNKAALEAVINKAKELDEDGYAVSTWSALQTALEAAEAVLESTEVSQSEVNNAADALQTAIDGLKAVLPVKLPDDESQIITISSQSDFSKMLSSEGKYYVLTQDITVDSNYRNESDWMDLTPFYGVLDGQGHTITFDNGGRIFYRVEEGAVIQNLGMRGTIASSRTSETAPLGDNMKGSVLNCWSDISGEYVAGFAQTLYGGIIANSIAIGDTENGAFFKSYNSGVIQNCYWLDTLTSSMPVSALTTSQALSEDDMKSQSLIETLNAGRGSNGIGWAQSEDGYPYFGENHEYTPGTSTWPELPAESLYETAFTGYNEETALVLSDSRLQVSPDQVNNYKIAGTFSLVDYEAPEGSSVEWGFLESKPKSSFGFNIESGELFVYGNGKGIVTATQIGADGTRTTLAYIAVVSSTKKMEEIRLFIDGQNVTGGTYTVQGSESKQIKVQARYEGEAIYKEVAYSSFSYEVSDPEYLYNYMSVSSSFYFKKPGTGTITVTSRKQSDISATVKLTSEYVPVEAVEPAIPDIYVLHGRNANSDGQEADGRVAYNPILGSAIVTPENASYSDNITITSSDETIGYWVNGEKAYVPKEAGTVTFTASIEETNPVTGETNTVTGQKTITFSYLNPLTSVTAPAEPIELDSGATANFEVETTGERSDEGYEVTEPALNWTYSQQGIARIIRTGSGAWKRDESAPDNNMYLPVAGYQVIGLSEGTVIATGTPVDTTNDVEPVTVTIKVNKGDTPDKDIDEIVVQGVEAALGYIESAHSETGYAYGNEWLIYGMLRAGRTINQDALEAYYSSVAAEVSNWEAGQKPTDIERVALALTAMGKDITDVGGVNLAEMIYNSDKLSLGANELIYALIALDAADITIPADAKWSRSAIIEELLKFQNPSNGGFGLDDNTSVGVDMTAMALQALANYQGRAEVSAAIEKAVTYLQESMREDFGYGNAESTAQVLLALSILDIDPLDPGAGFGTANWNIITNLMEYSCEDGGFSHMTSPLKSSEMSTVQVLQALNAYQKTQEGSDSYWNVNGEKNIVTFTLLGDAEHSSDTDGEIHTLAGGNLTVWAAVDVYRVSAECTVKELLDMVLAANQMTCDNPSGNYVKSITRGDVTIGEFTNGRKSGWMYTLNGVHPEIGVALQTVKDGDIVVFHYTDDYEREKLHNWKTEWSSDANSHWHECSDANCWITDNTQKDGYGVHTPGDWIIDNAATGAKHRACTVCGYVTETQAGTGTGTNTGTGTTAHTHSYGSWTTVSKATVFAAEVQKRTCACGASETRTVGTKLTPTIKLSATKFPMKVKQTTKKLTVSGLAEGDYVKSWKSSNTKVVKVTSKGVVKAQKKTGKATITVTLASGKTAKATVTVKKTKVKTTKITGVAKKLTLKKGKKYSLAAVLTPITSQDKITYTSSNKKVATVSKKGKITAKKKGTATITVKAGTKKVKCKVTVK